MRNISDLSSRFTIVVPGERRSAILNGAANANSWEVRGTSFLVDNMPSAGVWPHATPCHHYLILWSMSIDSENPQLESQPNSDPLNRYKQIVFKTQNR